MRAGLLADIHEDVNYLGAALREFHALGVERIVVLGDVFDTGGAIEGTVRLLVEAGAIGVWGNHDYGLCRTPGAWAREQFSPEVLRFTASLLARLELEDCLFTHLEPWRDPEDILALWGEEDLPGAERLARSFAASAQRVLFTGHHHRWRAAAPAGRLEWRGEGPIRLVPGRFLVNVAAVCEGWCGLYDTRTAELIPIPLSAEP